MRQYYKMYDENNKPNSLSSDGSINNTIRQIGQKFVSRKFVRKKNDLRYGLLRFMNPNGLYLKEIQGSKMYLDLNDIGISKELALSDIREEKATIMTYEVLKKGDVVIDIGANIGYYALIESRLVGNEGRVFAFEPAPENVKLLKKNIGINKYKNIEVSDFAVGDIEGLQTMYVSNRCNWNSMYKTETLDVQEEITVRLSTLNSLLDNKEYPNFIRMDVEGYETAIIRGMNRILEKDNPLMMFIEVHPHIMQENDLIEMLQTLSQFGFEVEMIAKREKLYNWKLADLLKNKSFLSGELGAFQVFFNRN